MARKKAAIHSVFEERYRLKITARDGDSEEDRFLRDLVSELNRRHGLGVAQEWIIGAICERFAREKASMGTPAVHFAQPMSPFQAPSQMGGQQAPAQPPQQAANVEPLVVPRAPRTSQSVQPPATEMAHEEDEGRVEIPSVPTVRMSDGLRGSLRGAM